MKKRMLKAHAAKLAVVSMLLMALFKPALAQFYDDCGNPDQDAHRIQGLNYSGWTDVDPATTPAQLSISYHPDHVFYHYEGLDPEAFYLLTVTYLQQQGETRHQSLYADWAEIHGDLALPSYTAQDLSYFLSEEIYTDGRVLLRFIGISGPNTVVSEIRIDEVAGIINVSDYPDPFAPPDSTWITAQLSETDDWDWTLAIISSEQETVRTFSGATTLDISQPWDGKDEGGMPVPDGMYSYTIEAINSLNIPAKPGLGKVVVGAFPVAIITEPVESAHVSGNVPIIGTATCVNFADYEVFYGVGADPSSWISIYYSTTPVSDDTLAIWQIIDLPDDTYTIQLVVVDNRGNIETERVTVFLLDHLLEITNISVYPNPFRPLDGETCDIHFEVNNDCAVSVSISDPGYSIIRTLVDPDVPAGSNSIVWDGRDDWGTIVADDAYTYAIEALDIYGNYAIYDPFFEAESVYITNATTQPSFNPYMNETCEVSYTLSVDARVTTHFYIPNSPYRVRELMYDASRLAGSHKEYWDGRDDNGRIYPDPVTTWHRPADLPENFIITESEPLTLTEVSSYLIISSYGQISTITYNLPRDAMVTIKVYDRDVIYVRTLINYELQLAGENSVYWDGTNDYGELVGTEDRGGPFDFVIEAQYEEGPPMVVRGCINVFN
jgi:flagellar hook assembly protein FlgD